MQPLEQPPLDEDEKICLATARYWYDYLKSENINATENAEQSMRDCMSQAGVNLKELLKSDKDNAALEKDLRQSLQKIYRKKAKECFDNIIKGELAYPETFEEKLREYMKHADVKSLKDFVPGDKDNAALEKDLQQSIRKVHRKKAKAFYESLVKGDAISPEDAEVKMREYRKYLPLAGGDLKELLASDKTNDALEKELQKGVLKIYRGKATECFESIIKDTLQFPEYSEARLREYMASSGAKDLKELLGSDEANEKLEAGIRAVIKPHMPRIHLSKARSLYTQIVGKESDTDDLEPMLKKVESYLKLAEEAASPLKPQLLDSSEKSLSNEEMLAPYKSAGGNLNLGHARRIYRDLINGRVEEALVEDQIDEMITYLKHAKTVDPALKLGLDPKGVKTDNHMIGDIYKKQEKKPVLADNYIRSHFMKDYDAFRVALEEGKADKAKEALKKMSEGFLAKYTQKDKAQEFGKLLGELRERYEDVSDDKKALKGAEFKPLKAQVDKLEKEAGENLEKTLQEKKPAPVSPSSPKSGKEDMGSNVIPSELVKRLALEAMGDSSALSIPRVAARKAVLKL